MTTSQTSLHLPLGPSPAALSLADVLAAIGTAPDLSAVRRRDQASAIRTIARLLGHHPAAVPAEPRLLARRLNELAPAALGLSAQRWANLRSMLRASLQLVGPVAPGRHLVPLNPAWKALWGQMGHRGLKIALSRVMRFAGSEGLDPRDVDTGLFDRFRVHLDRSLIKRPDSALRSARTAWERARASVPGWPDVPWPKGPRRPDHFSLPWTTFPGERRGEVSVNLRGDLAAFLHAAELSEGVALAVSGSPNSKKAANLSVGGFVGRRLVSLDAGTCGHFDLLVSGRC